MKIGGVFITKCEEVLVLPRMTGDLVFRAEAVDSMEYFEQVCPRPTAPKRLKAGGVKEEHHSEAFISELEQWSQRRYAYICVKSLEPSNIEWTAVDLKKASTWAGWMDELREAGLADVEINRVQTLILDANSLNEAKLKEARDSFLRGQGATLAESSGPLTTQGSSQSGRPAND